MRHVEESPRYVHCRLDIRSINSALGIRDNHEDGNMIPVTSHEIAIGVFPYLNLPQQRKPPFAISRLPT